MKKLTLLALLFLITVGAFAQQHVSGTVTDKTGFPLPGVTVLIKGTTTGAISDFDGVFTLPLAGGKGTLEISYIGYQTQTVPVVGGQKVKVVLEEAAQAIGPVVLIGYGSTKKEDLTGSVTTVKVDESRLSNGPSSVATMLQGSAAGVNVSMGGEPGAAASINIRGIGSLSGSTQPLYVIDGVVRDSAMESNGDPFAGATSTTGGLGGVAPEDIADIQVLKDASATAIYGSLGANGVIIITTKSGEKGKAKFKFNSTTTVGQPVNIYKMLSSQQFVNHMNQKADDTGGGTLYGVDVNADNVLDISDNLGSFYADGTISEYKDNLIARVKPIDWAKEMYRATFAQNHRLSLSGGTKNTKYYVSTGYNSSQGAVQNVFSNAFDVNATINQKFGKKLSVNTKLTFSDTNVGETNVSMNSAGSTKSVYKNITIGAPLQFTSLTEQNSLNLLDYEASPYGFIYDFDRIVDDKTYLGSVSLKYDFYKWLAYNLQVGVDYRKSDKVYWEGLTVQNGYANSGRAGISNLDRLAYNVDNTVDFKNVLRGDHSLSGTTGLVYRFYDNTNILYAGVQFNDAGIAARGRDFIKKQSVYGLPSNGGNVIISDPVDQSTLEAIASFIARANYGYKDKYLLTGTFRADASSKFSGANKVGYFPSFAFAWKVHKEDFLADAKNLNELKLRLGYGQTGNERIPAKYTVQGYVYDIPIPDSNKNALESVSISNVPNSELKWETAIQYNAGIDLSMFDQRLNSTLDFYIKDSKDLLNFLAVGGSSGVNNYYVNRGSLSNKGVEFSLNGDIIKTKDWTWNAYGNIAFNKTQIGDLGLDPVEFGQGPGGTPIMYSAYLGGEVSLTGATLTPVNIYIEGQEAGLFYGYKTNGIVGNYTETAVDANPENNKAIDVNNPSKIYPRIGGDLPETGNYNFVDQNGDGNIDDKDKTIIGNPNPKFVYGFGSSISYKDLSLTFNFNGKYGGDALNANYLFETVPMQYDRTNIREEAYLDQWNAVTNPDGQFPANLTAALGKKHIQQLGVYDKLLSDASFLRLQNVALNYKIPTEKVSFIQSANVSLSASNLLLFTKYNGYDPEFSSFRFTNSIAGVDIASPPRQRTFSIGLGLTF